MTGLKPNVDIARLARELDALAGFSEAEPLAVTRILYNDPDLIWRRLYR